MKNFFDFSTFQFAQPHYLWGLFIIIVLFFFLKRARIKKANALEKITFLGAMNADFLECQKSKDHYFVIGVIFLILALARPQWGLSDQVIKAEGLDIMLIQDVSTSMLAQDIQPSRLVRSKHEISQFLEQVQSDRVGLVGFAGEPRLVVPLTLDYAAVMNQLEILDPEEYMQGTNASAALELALQRSDSTQGAYQIFVLLSDGEEQDPGLEKMAQRVVERGITIYTIGIGSEDGVSIPIVVNGVTQNKRDQSGQEIKTRLNSKILRQVAAIGNGRYYHAGPGSFELEKILKDIRTRAKKHLETSATVNYTERYVWFVAFGLVFIVLECILGCAKRRLKWPIFAKTQKKNEGKS
jgi:Ca-activated chloride channel family protein